MGRLVDTDVLVKIIDKHTNDDSQLDNDITCILEEVPTAYDVEKVMKQIHDYFCKVIDDCEEDIVPHEILKYNKAICEIVRSGGME